MTVLSNTISGYVVGDDLEIQRSIEVPQAISKAWFTVKSDSSDSDEDAILQKIITDALTTDGQIMDTGSGGTATISFTISGANSRTIGTSVRKYDIQVKLADGKIATPEIGTIRLKGDVTKATS